MGQRARAVEIARYAAVVLDLVSIVSTMQEMSLLNRIIARAPFTADELRFNDGRQGAIATVAGLTTLVLAVLFIRWLRQGLRNADVIAPGVRRHGQGWAIGAWFVPILNLFRPKQIVNDAYAAGHDRKSGSKDGLLTWWWVVFLVADAINSTVARSRPDDLMAIRAADRWLTFGNVLEIVAAVLAIMVVRKISAALDETAGRAPARALTGLTGGWEPPATSAPTFAAPATSAPTFAAPAPQATGSVPPPGWD